MAALALAWSPAGYGGVGGRACGVGILPPKGVRRGVCVASGLLWVRVTASRYGVGWEVVRWRLLMDSLMDRGMGASSSTATSTIFATVCSSLLTSSTVLVREMAEDLLSIVAAWRSSIMNWSQLT